MKKKNVKKYLMCLLLCLLFSLQSVQVFAAEKIMENLAYEMTTIADEKVSTLAESKPKVLIFMKTGCFNCKTVLQSFQNSELDFNGVDIIAAEFTGRSKAETEEFFQSYGTEKITCCYGADSIGWAYLRSLGVDQSTITTPVIIFINSENEVVHYTIGMNRNVISDIKTYLGIDMFQDEGETEVPDPGMSTFQLNVTDVYSAAFDMVDLINEQRSSRGLSKLTMDKELLNAAMTRSHEITVLYSNTRPNGKYYLTVNSDIEEEQIATLGYPVPAALVNYWVNQGGDSSKILNSSYQSVGVGVCCIDDVYYWELCFGTKKAESAERSNYKDQETIANIEIDTKKINVRPQINIGSSEMKVGDEKQVAFTLFNGTIRITIPPENLNYSSSNTSICSVSATGQVKAKKEGTVTLTVNLKNVPEISNQINISVVAGELPFSDVSSKMWYYDTVKNAYAAGLMTGTTDTTFEPDKPMSRGMVATVLYRMAGAPDVKYQSVFSDVSKTAYYAQAVTWAYQNKIISGYGNGKFGPDDNVTREEMAVMLCNYARHRGMNVNSNQNLKTFVDYKNITSYAVPSIKWVVQQKIISGTEDGKLNPTLNATRAECAKMLLQSYRILNQY